MKTYELIAPCHFGLEAVLKREIQDLGYDVTLVEDGKVTFVADAEGITRANVFLRTAERVLLKVGKFKAETFDELFENTKALPWEEYLPQDAKFWVAKAASIKSKLFSPSDIQSIMKKAIVYRFHSFYNGFFHLQTRVQTEILLIKSRICIYLSYTSSMYINIHIMYTFLFIFMFKTTDNIIANFIFKIICL